MDKANLGLATTRELLEEIVARCDPHYQDILEFYLVGEACLVGLGELPEEFLASRAYRTVG